MSDEKALSLTIFLATLNAVSNGWNWRRTRPAAALQRATDADRPASVS